MSGNTIKVKLGGEQHTWRIELRLAPQIEDATGKGFLLVARELMDRTAPTSVAAHVISLAFKANEKDVEPAAVYDMLAHEGLAQAYVIALQVITELMRVPERAKAGKAAGAPANAA